MPGLAKLNDNIEEFRSTYTLSILIVMLVSVPAATGVAALSVPIVDVLLGPKWAAAAELVKITGNFWDHAISVCIIGVCFYVLWESQGVCRPVDIQSFSSRRRIECRLYGG